MKQLDVSPFQEGIQRNKETLNRLQEQMAAIKTSAQTLADLGDSLTGDGGDAIKAFYRECHLPVLEYFDTFKQSFETALTNVKSAQEALEPDPSGYIKESFLESEVETGLATISTTTSNLTADANGIMDSVGDIVALPHLNDSEVQAGIKDARKKKDETVTDLNEFDSAQTNSLTAIENDILRMELWILDVEGMMNDGLTDVDFPAEEWLEFSEAHPLNTGEDYCAMPVDSVEDKEESGDSGEVSGTPMNWASLSKAVQSASGIVENLGTADGAASAFALYLAGRNGGIYTTRNRTVKAGEYGYRVYATKKAMETLKVPFKNGDVFDGDVLLKYATKKTGQTGWYATGEKVKQAHPSIGQFVGTKTTGGQKVKIVGSATLRGAADTVKDLVDVKGMAGEFKRIGDSGVLNKASGLIRGTGKALGPVGAAFSYHGNYQDAVKDGLSGGDAVKRAAADTAVDTVVGGTVQAAFTAAGTALIPIPGVGTAVGMAAGFGANWLLNKEIGDSGKSAMDHIKGWFR